MFESLQTKYVDSLIYVLKATIYSHIFSKKFDYYNVANKTMLQVLERNTKGKKVLQEKKGSTPNWAGSPIPPLSLFLFRRGPAAAQPTSWSSSSPVNKQLPGSALAVDPTR
jgi:hypothetical protein